MLGTNFCGAISLEFPGVGNVQGIYSREYSGGWFFTGYVIIVIICNFLQGIGDGECPWRMSGVGVQILCKIPSLCIQRYDKTSVYFNMAAKKLD